MRGRKYMRPSGFVECRRLVIPEVLPLNLKIKEVIAGIPIHEEYDVWAEYLENTLERIQVLL